MDKEDEKIVAAAIIATAQHFQEINARLAKLERAPVQKAERIVSNLQHQLNGIKQAQNLSVLTTAYLAAFGRDGAKRSLERSGQAADREGMEREIYFAGIEVPGYEFSHLAAKYGPPKPLHGLRRVEAAERQQSVNAALSRL